MERIGAWVKGSKFVFGWVLLKKSKVLVLNETYMENEEIDEDIMGLKEKQFWLVFREETDRQNTEDIMQKFKVIQV